MADNPPPFTPAWIGKNPLAPKKPVAAKPKSVVVKKAAPTKPAKKPVNASQIFLATNKAAQKKGEYKTGGLEHALNKALPAVLGLPADYTASNLIKHPVRTYERQAAKAKTLDAQMKTATLAGDKAGLNALTRKGVQFEAIMGPFGSSKKLAGDIAGAAEKKILPAVAEKVNQEAVDSAAGAAAAKAAGDTPLFTGVKPTAEDKLLRGMKGAEKGYKKQKVARSSELSTRAAKASTAYKTIADPFEADRAARAALKGELPKNELNALPDMTHEELGKLISTVNNYEPWAPVAFKKVNTNAALRKVFAGGQPTPSEIKLIEQVFGSDKVRQIAAATGSSWGDKLVNVINIPRSLQSSLDISGLTRQAFVGMTTHPIIWGKASPSYIKAFRTGNYHLIDEAVKNDPLYHLAVGHVSFSGIGDGVSLGAHEEAFASEYATKIPVIGHAVKGSAQGYVAFLNKFRMDLFSHFVRLEMKAGRDPTNEKFLKSVGEIVNAATGRGAMHARLEHVMPAANTLLYSPRLMLSRLNYFDPTWYVRLHSRRARIEALKGLFATTGYVTGVVTLLSQIPGVNVGGWDGGHLPSPLSSDFGKLRIGDTRVDVAAGFLQYIHLAAMLEANAKINSTSGNRIEFGTGYGQQTRWDQIQNFAINKAAPPVSFTIGMFKGHDPTGDPMSLSSPGAAAHVAGNMFIPLAIQDAQSLYKQRQGGMDGITAAIAGYGASGVGLGLQTYGSKPAKAGSSSSSAVPGFESGGGNPPPGFESGGGNPAP